ITFDSDSTSTWLYATDCPTHLLVTVSDGTRLLYRRWHKVGAGLGHIAVSLPEGVESAVMSVAATGLYRSTQTTVRLTRPKLKKGIRLSAETIRDRVVPGGQEIWRLRVTDLSGRGREAAVIADMYNTALDALTSSVWTFSPLSGRQLNWNWNRPMLSSRTSIGRPAPYAKYKECPPEVSLQFNSYGRGWSSFGNRHVYRNMAMLKRDASDEVMIEEEIALDSAPMMATRSYASAQTKMMAGGMAMADDLAEAVNADAGEAEPTEAGDEPNREFAYRDSETPLAFFRPDLTSEADGSLALQFTLPDANTTWGFRAVAWTDSLLTALYSLDVIASKPLMVKPNAPRFIRFGDRVQIPALVMNATDSTITADVLVELFNPSDGLATTALRKTVTVQAGATDTVGIHLTAPSCGAFTGYRVKVSAEGWTDGEQMLIPILPSSTPVIESLPFCIAPDSASITLNIPAIPADGRRELQLCLNPVWYVVTALPGLLDNEATTAPEAARSLFSAAMARGLLAANPAIAEAMAEWSASDRDGAILTSMLERNAELRNVLLAATPWMSDADSDTERMSRLALLLDSKTVNSVISSALNTLYNLWQGDGWSWCAQYPRTSEWASSQVLGLCGRLAELGMLPVDKKLRSMLAEALDADTRRELNIYTRHPHSDFTHYVMLHDLYRSLGIGTPASQLVDAALSHITADWKKSSLTDKARYAIILNNHNYTRTAGAILASIAEYARTTPELGTFFPSLSSDAIAATSMIMRAYLAVDPHSSAIDGIRQWLTRQKSMQNWGDSATTTDVIATFLTSSSRWLVPAGDATIMINNTEQTVSTASRLTGELSMAIPTGQTALYVSRAGHTPASGAVYSIYTLPLSQIKGSACPELSIEKSLSRTLADGTIESVNEATTLHPGDKVTVTLTLRAAETMDYVIVTDCRAACFEPTEQLPAPVWSEGICFYRENRNSETRLFIDRLPKGIYKLSYTLHVNSAGTFTSGIATAQSQYAPRITSHTPATTLTSKF
ncbi:MAG: hypothetical protein J1E29_05950, partial [Duncaniella sp.]|nr:hypothetical protein [Duncaniella sp.]